MINSKQSSKIGEGSSEIKKIPTLVHYTIHYICPTISHIIYNITVRNNGVSTTAGKLDISSSTTGGMLDMASRTMAGMLGMVSLGSKIGSLKE